MPRTCPCCQSSDGMKFDYCGSHGTIDVRNGGIKVDCNDKGTGERAIVYAPANFCPECGRDLRDSK